MHLSWSRQDLDLTQRLQDRLEQSKQIGLYPQYLHYPKGGWEQPPLEATPRVDVTGWVMDHFIIRGWPMNFELFGCGRLPGRERTDPDSACDSSNKDFSATREPTITAK
jgi:hypothetical protein